jgi:hypothetical protein
MLKKIIIIILLNFLIFFSAGKILFDKTKDVKGKLDPFLDSMENPKIGLYFIDLGNLQKNHKYISLEFVNPTGTVKKACYEIHSDKLKKIPECKDDAQIILDEHATSMLIFGPTLRPFYILLSEFLMGHVKFKGLTPYDFLYNFLAVLKW